MSIFSVAIQPPQADPSQLFGKPLAQLQSTRSHFLKELLHNLKRVGGIRARAVGCLTEPGIVCFPAVSRSKQEKRTKTQGREAVRGRRGSSARPCPNPAGTRTSHQKQNFQTASNRSFSTLQQTTRTASINPIPILQKTPAQPQAGRRGSGKGWRLSDRARNRLLPGRLTLKARKGGPKLKDGKQYEGRRGSPVRPCPNSAGTRPSHQEQYPQTASNRSFSILRQTTRTASINSIPILQKTPAQPQAGSAGFGQGLAAV